MTYSDNNKYNSVETKYLEDYRLNEYLNTYMLVWTDSCKPKVEMTFNGHALQAFYSTFDDIRDLENEKNFVNGGRRAIISISLWYLSVEALINGLCKTLSFVLGLEPDEQIGKNINARLNFLVTTFGYDNELIRKSGIYKRLSDFTRFRNELFHDRNTGKQILFKNTNFSPTPVFCNQIDVFQSMLIFIELATLFRYSINGLDLMPNISLRNSKVLHFEKLDILYNQILLPFFKNSLSKHNLRTHLNLEINKFTSLLKSEVLHLGDVVVISRVEQEERFKHTLDQSETAIGTNLYSKVLNKYQLPDGHVSGQNFILNWPELYKSRPAMRR